MYYIHGPENILRMLILPKFDLQNAYNPSRLFVEVHSLILNLHGNVSKRGQNKLERINL